MVFFVVIACVLVLLSLGMVSLALPGASICCLSSDCHARDAWCTCHRGCVFVVVVAAACKLLLLARLVVQISAALIVRVIGVLAM
jgi:hypothetical protein